MCPKLVGGLKTRFANRVRVGRTKKIVNLLKEKEIAEGADGKIKSATLYFRRRNSSLKTYKKNFVVKEYHNVARQSELAEKEFRAFRILKRNGFPVPPTFRLVMIKGRRYLLLSDLVKKNEKMLKFYEYDERAHGGMEIEEFRKQIGINRFGKLVWEADNLRNRAKDKLGINLSDSFEILYNPVTKRAKLIIWDLGIESGAGD